MTNRKKKQFCFHVAFGFTKINGQKKFNKETPKKNKTKQKLETLISLIIKFRSSSQKIKNKNKK